MVHIGIVKIKGSEFPSKSCIWYALNSAFEGLGRFHMWWSLETSWFIL